MDIAAILHARAKAAATAAASRESATAVAAAAPLPAARHVFMAAAARPAGEAGAARKCAEALTEAARRKARERLRFVRMVDRAARDLRVPVKDAAAWVAENRAESFPELADAGKHGASALRYANYRNWKKAAVGCRSDEQAVAALADAYVSGPREPAGPSQFWECLRAAWLNLNRLPMTVAYDVAARRMRQLDPAAQVPSIHQAKRHLEGIRKDLVILAREGETAHRNACMDYITRDWSAMPPGDMLVGDNRTFDTRIKVWDGAAGKWIAVRPTVCALMDAASWHLAAWAVTPCPPNAEIIVNTLAQYCAQNGAPPRHAYFDNGRDFCARGFSTPFVTSDGSQHSIFRELGVELTNSIAYNARAKTVEMFFHELMQGFDKLFADYLGSRPGQRAQAADWFDRHPEGLPTLQEFTERLQAFLDEFDRTPKHGRIHQGRSPMEIWEARERPEPISPATFRLAFARPVGEYTVGRGPAVNVRKRMYVSDALEYGDRVLVKADPVNPEVVHCFTLRGAYIATATLRQPVPALATSQEDRDALREALRRQYRQLREARTALRAATGGLHVLSPAELLQLPQDGARIVRMGTIASVKGAAHEYTRYAIARPGGEPAQTAAQETPPQPADPELAALISQARHRFDQEAAVPREGTEREIDTRAAAPDPDDDQPPAQEIDIRALAADDGEAF